MFSLCIPTLDRYDIFLNKYLPQYLDNELISEIVITDENGNDINKIILNLKNNNNFNKLKLIKNDKRLGPFLNKYKACLAAKNEWIALIDSDNFADKKYFDAAKMYILSKIGDKKNIILAPSKALPNFDFSHLDGLVYKKGSFKYNKDYERNNIKKHNANSIILMNTGNYVINKYLINNLDLSKEIYINKSSACDVIYFNTLLFEQLDLNLHVVTGLEYTHVVHNNSIYLQTRNINRYVIDFIHKRNSNLV
jgi:hypothetical protein